MEQMIEMHDARKQARAKHGVAKEMQKRQAEVGKNEHPWTKDKKTGRDEKGKDLLFRYPYHSAAFDDLELRALAYNESKIFSRSKRVQAGEKEEDIFPKEGSMEHEYVYAAWQGCCYCCFPPGEFSNVAPKYPNEKTLLLEHKHMLPSSVLTGGPLRPGPKAACHRHHRHKEPTHIRHYGHDPATYCAYKDNKGCLGREDAGFAIKYEGSKIVCLDEDSDLSRFDIGNWGLACPNCQIVKEKDAEVALADEGREKAKINTRRKQVRKAKIERQQAKKTGGQVYSSDPDVAMLQKEYIPKVNAVLAMKHAIHQNHLLRRMAHHHRARYPEIGNSMQRFKRKPRSCRECHGPMEWSKQPETYKHKQFRYLKHKLRMPKLEGRAYHWKEGWRCNYCDKYFEGNPERLVCYKCFSKDATPPQKAYKTGYNWKRNEFYDCCTKCERHHRRRFVKGQRKSIRLWYLDSGDDSVITVPNGLRKGNRGGVFDLDFYGCKNAALYGKRLHRAQRYGSMNFRRHLKKANHAVNKLATKHRKILNQILKSRKVMCEKKHTELRKRLAESKLFFNHSVKHELKHYAHAAVDQTLCERVLEMIHEQQQLFVTELCKGREKDLKYRQRYKHFDNRYWDHGSDRQAVFAHKKRDDIVKEAQWKIVADKIQEYNLTRPGRHGKHGTKVDTSKDVDTAEPAHHEVALSGDRRSELGQNLFRAEPLAESKIRAKKQDEQAINKLVPDLISQSHAHTDDHVLDFYASVSIIGALHWWKGLNIGSLPWKFHDKLHSPDDGHMELITLSQATAV